MSHILHELYHGEIHPAERYASLTEELKEKRKALLRKEQALLEKLDKSAKQELIELFDEGNMVMSEKFEDVYIQGMRMGAQMAAALLQEEKRPPDPDFA